MARPVLIDLYCGAGGASMGYHRAGFHVVGVDIVDQPRYPFDFVRADALSVDLNDFDAIHASPPCQAYSVLRRANPGVDYPDLIAPTRAALSAARRPCVIENVPGAPLFRLIELCGSMFGLGAMSGNGVSAARRYRQLRRHRLFDTNVPMVQPPCRHRAESLGVYGGGTTGRYTYANRRRRFDETRRGGYQGTVAEKRVAMGIDWMTAQELSQAIPPAYTEWIGAQLIAAVRASTRNVAT